MQSRLIRTLDILFAALGLLVTLPLILIILITGYLDSKSPLFLQQRVGQSQQPFTLLKFRTMAPETESVGTHLVNSNAITSLGRFLRKTKLDELPQLVNVLLGDMSLVGPRPCLPNQRELIEERNRRGVWCVRGTIAAC